ncbi:MAG: ROK family protein [Gemmataceae bacterium]|nr:ROK family protein [Gemmataceae bacterium]
MFVGIEIGGTKLQLGLGAGDGLLQGLWRGEVDAAAGAEGIRRQILAAVPELLARAGVERAEVRGVAVGFGGPVDDSTRTVIRSHQIEGWDNFPLADWITELLGWDAVLGNDADVAGLAEALFGAGKGLSPIFYITIGSGIGGGLIIDGEIYRGCGRGAAEIGHMTFFNGEGFWPLEAVASGWGMVERVRELLASGVGDPHSLLVRLVSGDLNRLTAQHIAQAARKGDEFALQRLADTRDYLAEALCNVIALLCPRRIVIGGGVSLMGERLLFGPLRRLVGKRVFEPFRGCYDIVPAALGEEVVVHGALALARKRLGR